MTPASKPAAATSSAGGASRAPPPPPSRNVAPPPPPPPEEPDVEQYKAKFAFEGQPGEMTLKKDDIVELVEKTDNGWWLVKMNGSEGWAPNNYLELVPPKPKARPAAAPPPPPPPPAAPRPPAAPAAPKIVAKPVTADASAKPVAVFPGMAPSNGSATPWKKSPATTANGSSASTPAASRPGSSLAGKPPPPPVANKPKPTPPPLANKPGAPKPPVAGGKPPIPTAPRPGVAKPPARPGGVAKPAAVGGQMDLAAAVSILDSHVDRLTDVGICLACEACAEDCRRRVTNYGRAVAESWIRCCIIQISLGIEYLVSLQIRHSTTPA